MKLEFEEIPRLIDFRNRTRFKKRARKNFLDACVKDQSSVSAVIRHLSREVYLYDQMGEYGTSLEEKERIVNERIEYLPQRYRFLSEFAYFIAQIQY